MMVDAVARAVLYEGFSLYPYRASALKNRRRILFGTLVPAAWAAAQNAGEAASAATEVVLVASHEAATVDVSLRFLCLDEEPHEVVIPLPKTTLDELVRVPLQHHFETDGISGTVRVEASRPRAGVYRTRVVIENTTAIPSDLPRDGAERFAMGAAHFVIHAERATCASQIDPPADVADVATSCRQDGLFPVLVGQEGTNDTMLASPIILYDHPKVAPESTGDLFDATEIEEILSLRVQTLTDAEKNELRSEPRTRALLERVEALGPQDLERLHGAFRGGKSGLAIGDHVRLHPKSRADALDVLLGGMDATVVSIEQTLEGEDLVCVTIDRDPGKDLGERGFPGHRFFFRPDEMERTS